MEKKTKRALVFLAPGFEEVEALTPVDYLRRAGVEVCTAALDAGAFGKTAVTGSHDIRITADAALSALAGGKKLDPLFWDAVILPGGLPGASNLAADSAVNDFILAMAGAGKWVCAICAAPAVVLAPLGILSGRNFTCFPGMEKDVSGANWSEERTVVDKNPSGGGIITGRGAGTAGEFACAIAEKLAGEGEGSALASRVLLAYAR